MNEQLQEIFNDKPLLEKFMLAWYLSIPSDSPTTPHKIVMKYIGIKNDIHFEKINTKGVMYGISSTTIGELERYYASIESMLSDENKMREYIEEDEDNKDKEEQEQK